MPYIKRDNEQRIIAVYGQLAPGTEEVAADNAELLNFLARLKLAGEQTELHYQLTESDIKLIRAIEDVIDVLISKDVIAITDLPPSVIDRIQSRKTIRSKLREYCSINITQSEAGGQRTEGKKK
jgi:hypothetical protein